MVRWSYETALQRGLRQTDCRGEIGKMMLLLLHNLGKCFLLILHVSATIGIISTIVATWDSYRPIDSVVAGYIRHPWLFYKKHSLYSLLSSYLYLLENIMPPVLRIRTSRTEVIESCTCVSCGTHLTIKVWLCPLCIPQFIDICVLINENGWS